MSTDVFDLTPSEREVFAREAGREWDDVFDPVPHVREQGGQAQEPVSTPQWSEDDTVDSDKLPFLSWLWRHHIPGDEFYPLAHLVLSGGPDDVWARKTVLMPSWVAHDIAEFYAVGRHGVTEEHLDLANRSVFVYRTSTETVNDLVTRRRRGWGKTSGFGPGQEIRAAKDLKAAQAGGFIDLDTVPIAPSPTNSTGASVRDMVPDVSAEQLPAHFVPVRVACAFVERPGGGIKGQTLVSCARPSVPGSMLCSRHGGVSLAYSHEELKEIYDGARQRLIAATLMAVDTTIELARSSTNDMVRLKAAEIVLDRTGFVPGVAVHLPGAARDGQVDKTPAQIILERLNQLGAAVPTQEPSNGSGHEAVTDDSDVVEGEVVEAEVVRRA